MAVTDEDKRDIQGLIVSGYSNLSEACFVLVNIEDVARAKLWLEQITAQVRFASNVRGGPQTLTLNIAFTSLGLKKLGLDQIQDPDKGSANPKERSVMSGFAAAFRAGMTTPHRQRILGDNAVNGSDPTTWEWGGPGNKEVHILLLLYTSTTQELREHYNRILATFEDGGLKEIRKLNESSKLTGDKEHFGFRDGISNPGIEGLSTRKPVILKPGEFLLGYKNEYELYAERPLIPPEKDPEGLLVDVPKDDEYRGKRDFGRNGSYLVFRQLEQNVHVFWKTIDQKARAIGVEPVYLAAKMVGRWPSGAPLILSPHEDQAKLGEENSFFYHQEDQHGLICPFGAHIRRTNPRDSLDPDPGTDRSITINRRHRIIRRGRAYGAPVQNWLKGSSQDINVEAIVASEPDAEERGLHFMCLNVAFNRQFEFIQDTWINNPKFAGMYEDTDPLLGDRARHSLSGAATFNIPANPVRKRVQGLPPFVRTRGGAYFFLPSKRALKFLARLPK